MPIATVKQLCKPGSIVTGGHQNPETFLRGQITEKLQRSEVVAPFRRNGARTPGVDEWVAVLGDEPVFILLDALPTYLEIAHGEPVGSAILGIAR
jgi:hypothetical protein